MFAGIGHTGGVSAQSLFGAATLCSAASCCRLAAGGREGGAAARGLESKDTIERGKTSAAEFGSISNTHI